MTHEAAVLTANQIASRVLAPSAVQNDKAGRFSTIAAPVPVAPFAALTPLSLHPVASTILGLVGGGGLCQAIYSNVQLRFYPRLSTLILLIYALVLTSDWIGERLRLRIA